jgi:hypothetical protein
MSITLNVINVIIISYRFNVYIFILSNIYRSRLVNKYNGYRGKIGNGGGNWGKTLGAGQKETGLVGRGVYLGGRGDAISHYL